MKHIPLQRVRSFSCWSRLMFAIERLPDTDKKQYELDEIARIMDGYYV